MFEKTVPTAVSAEASIYAVPRTKWEIEKSEDGCPYTYELSTAKPWQTGVVKMIDVKLMAALPGGLPLLDAAIETLKEAMREEQRDSAKRMEDMQKQIDTLALLEHIPEEEPANPVDPAELEPEGEDPDDFDDSMDGDFDSAMTSAGLGTDEDYGGGMERL